MVTKNIEPTIQENSNNLNRIILLIQSLWMNRKSILLITLLFSLLGIFIAIFTPNTYSASCTFVPQTNQKNTGGSISGLAAMAGINLGNLNTGEILSPSVYPKIMKNVNFQKEIIYSKYHFKDINEPISLFEYYSNKKYQKFSFASFLKKYTIGLPGVIIGLIKGTTEPSKQSNNLSIQQLSSKENNVIDLITSNLILGINNKDGYVSLTANMQDPILAAELVQKVQELLQKYITEFKIEKIANHFNFVLKNYEESKKNFEQKQVELAKFRDSNKSLTTSLSKTNEDKLISEYNILFNVYTELSKQKEQAKISLSENTPLFTIIEPVIIPNEKSKPNRTIILLAFTFMGLIIGIAIVCLKLYFPTILCHYSKIIN